MSKFLIATAFDAVSHNAAIYGLSFANAIGARATLCNVFDTPVAKSATLNQQQQYNRLMQSDAALLEEAEAIDPEKKIIDILCDDGSAPDAIMEMAYQENADLIVIGLRSYQPGHLAPPHLSTGLALAVTTRVPILMVPRKAVYSAFINMIFIQTENSGGLKNLTEQIISAAEYFHSPITVWSKPADDVSLTEDIPALFQGIIAGHKPDCIVMIQPDIVWLRAISENSDLPLLVLPTNAIPHL